MGLLETATLKIDKLVYGGDGLGRLDTGEVVLVPYAAPGDVLSIDLKPKPKKPTVGIITEILSPGPGRTAPRCSVFEQCGGCQWQHLERTTQHHWKQAIVEESLVRLGKLTNLTVQPLNLESEERLWHSRNKVVWHVDQEGPSPNLGYLAANSNRVVVFEHCHIIPEAWTALYHFLSTQTHLLACLTHIQVQTNEQDEWLITLFTRETLLAGLPGAESLQAWAETFPQIKGIIVSQNFKNNALYAQPYLIHRLFNYSWRVSSSSFFQVNHHQAQMMLTYIRQQLPEYIETLMDLYAGVGFFSIGLADKAQQITAIESHPDAIEDLQFNAVRNDISDKLTVIHEDVSKALKDKTDSPSVCVVDPPRQGCGQHVLSWMAEHVQEWIVYISCNPTTLARDLAYLTRHADHAWQIKTIQPFDLFPQTYHVETVVFLQRKAN